MKTVSEGRLLTEQVLHWSYYEPSLRCDMGCCAIRTHQGVLLVDPLPMGPAALSQLMAFGTPSAILITNGNHERASMDIQERWDIPILAEEGAREELLADEWLRDGQAILGNLHALHLPGAGAGEIAVVQKNSLCVFGDFLIHLKPGYLELLPEKYCENPRLAKKSLTRLQGLDCPLLLFAHGIPIVEEGSLQLENFLNSVLSPPEPV